MLLEVGRSYRTRAGERADVVADDEDEWPMCAKVGRKQRTIYYSRNGNASVEYEDPDDIVAEWSENDAPAHDPINRPAHYCAGKLEVYEAIAGMELGYTEGNIVKYVARHKFKNGVEDLQKARWYLDRLIESYKET
jgi:hypothetical protein